MADSESAVCNMALDFLGASGSRVQSLQNPTSNEEGVCALHYPQVRDELLRGFKWPWAQRRAYPSQLGGSAWSSTETGYAAGDYVSYVPDLTKVTNPPELLTTFVYMALTGGGQNVDLAPDSNPAAWRLISRAAWPYVFLPPSDVLQIHDIYRSNLRNPREDQHVRFELGYEPSPGPGTLLFTDTGLPFDLLGDTSNPVSIEVEYTAQVTDPKQFPPDFTRTLAWHLAVPLELALRKDPDAATRAQQMASLTYGEAIANAKLGERHDPEPLPSYLAARRTRRGSWRP